MNNQPVILIDWGSTNLRAWHCTSHGEILDMLVSEKGVTRISQNEIPEILSSLIELWFGKNVEKPVNIIMAGMIGSERGLGGVPYVQCPTPVSAITPKLHMTSDKRMNVWVVPGVSVSTAVNHNVMRGEETQLIGAWGQSHSGTYIMPGTHSKWVRVENGIVESFHTVMTGELYHLLMKESLIGCGLPKQNENEETFLAGVIEGLKTKKILSSIFEVRGAYVLNGLNKRHVGEYLSGLLIGAEVRQMIPFYHTEHDAIISMIAEDHLSRRYEIAFNLAEIASERIDGKKAFLFGMRGFINDIIK